MPKWFPFLLLPILLSACRAVPAGEEGRVSTPPPPGTILASPAGRPVAFDRMIADVADDRVVYLGEQHDNDFHHRMQLEVVKALHRQDSRLLIGMEMFQRPFQEALDRFIAGEIDEEGLLREADYFTTWAWDYRYYRPILLYAREHRIPVIALNAPKEARQKWAAEGYEGLSPEERRWVAEEIDLSIAAHREFLEEIALAHPMGPGFDFEKFYRSQCVWEDTMAESVARGLAAHPDHRMAVIVGGGHVNQRYGIPIRAERRGARPYSILAGMVSRPEIGQAELEEILAEDYGDYLVFTRPSPRIPPTVRLGVMLDDAAEGEGVLVTRAIPGGTASLAGVRDEDRITAVDGRPVSSTMDLKVALTLLADRMSRIEVQRAGERLELPFDTEWARP